MAKVIFDYRIGFANEFGAGVVAVMFEGLLELCEGDVVKGAGRLIPHNL